MNSLSRDSVSSEKNQSKRLLRLVLLVSIAGIASIILIAGGMTVLDTFLDPPHHEVIVSNEDTSGHSLSITISRGEKIVVDQEMEIGEKQKQPLITLEKRGQYTVVVKMDNGVEFRDQFSLPIVERSWWETGGEASYSRITITEEGQIELVTYYQQ